MKGILYIRDENGNFIPIDAIKGEKGDPGEGAYASAVKGGYKGTEEDLNKALAEVVKMQTDIGVLYTDAAFFYEHKNNNENPHGVSCDQIGAATKVEVGNISSDISNGRVWLDQFSSETLGYSEQVGLGEAMVGLSERISALVISVGDIQQRLGM